MNFPVALTESGHVPSLFSFPFFLSPLLLFTVVVIREIMEAPPAPEVTLRGVLKGHDGWVTAIATPPENSDVLISGSRDKSIIIWDLTKEDAANYGVPRRSLTGHSHFVSDVVISSDGQFVLSGSWDSTLRLWDINAGVCHRRFVGHKKDVLSVAFSADNRQIVSGSRDKTIKLWNTLGVCKYTIEENGHSEWTSCVRFTPNMTSGAESFNKPLIVSAGWDKLVKVDMGGIDTDREHICLIL